MTPTVKVPHVHSEVIKAYADGAQIEFRHAPNREWEGVAQPHFDVGTEYRVKPEPRAYPVTQMSIAELTKAYNDNQHINGLVGIANAALRHSIDAKQIITMADHHEEMMKHDDARDMAIARAVENTYCVLVPNKRPSSDNYLAAIIAKVAP